MPPLPQESYVQVPSKPVMSTVAMDQLKRLIEEIQQGSCQIRQTFISAVVIRASPFCGFKSGVSVPSAKINLHILGNSEQSLL